LVAQDNNGSLIGPGGGAVVARLTSSAARSWTDRNNNLVVDCNLTDQTAQNQPGPGFNPAIDSCGAGNLGFGQPTTNTVFDPAILASSTSTGTVPISPSMPGCRKSSSRAVSRPGGRRPTIATSSRNCRR